MNEIKIKHKYFQVRVIKLKELYKRTKTEKQINKGNYPKTVQRFPMVAKPTINSLTNASKFITFFFC